MQRAAAKSQKKLTAAKKQTTTTKRKPVVTKKRNVATKANKAKKTTATFSISAPTVKTQARQFSTTGNFATFTEGPILTELADHGVLLVKFNNPAAFNAMNVDMGDRMVDIIQQIREDNGSNVKAVVLTGMGKAFSAGGDLKFLKERSLDTPANNVTQMLQFYDRFLGLRTLPVPTIAAINGPAVGAGIAVASLADYRIASSSATMGWTFSNLGLHPGMASTFYLPKMTKPSIATHLLLSGEIIGAQTAKEYGIVNDIFNVEGDDVEANNKKLIEHAVNHAHEYTKFHSLASFTLLKNLRTQQDVGLQEAIKNEAYAQALTYASPEFTERLDKMINRKKK